MSLTRREAFARLMEHMCTHDGAGGHGYSQIARMGNGAPETVDLGDGVRVTIAGGDRDCSSGVVTALRAVGVDTYGASYTGNMRAELLKTGLFRWERMGVASAQRGDIYLNEGQHTAVCVSAYGSARGDLLAQFSISENGSIRGKVGDQTGRESNIKAYYSYPWDGKLVWVSDGGTIGDATTPGSFAGGLGDLRYWGPRYSRETQSQLGTEVDGIVSRQPAANRQWLPNADAASWDFRRSVSSGSPMVVALQRKIGAQADGWFGNESVRKLQAWLGVEVDGYAGPDTMTAFGRALADGRLRG